MVDGLFDRFMIEGEDRDIRRVAGLRNEYYHKTCADDYDILNTNPAVLKKITFYHPITKSELGVLTG